MSGLGGRHWAAAVDDLAAAFASAETELCGYDGAIGDGDHGSSMVRGLQAAQAGLRARPAALPSEVLARTGEAFVENVGGVTGMVFGSLFRAAAGGAAGAEQTGARELAAMFAAGLAEVQRVGRASPGDKSMVDALAPAVQALQGAARAGLTAAGALEQAARAAEAGREATVGMEARVGRARYQASGGRGHVDAGAASVCVLFQVLARTAARADG